MVEAGLTKQLPPAQWAARVVDAYHEYEANCIVAEVNQGGDMVESTVKAQAKNRVIPYRAVHATRGKQVRATPIAALYEQGKVRHAQPFPELEDQCCAFTIDFDRSAQGYSPDRVDALVWALTDLFPQMVQKKNAPPVAPPPTAVMPMAGRRR